MWTTTTTTAASVALVTAVTMAPAPQEAAVSIAGAETARDRAALEGYACLLACLKVLHAPGDVIWTKVGNTYSPVFTQLGNTRIIHEYMYSLSLPRNCE